VPAWSASKESQHIVGDDGSDSDDGGNGDDGGGEWEAAMVDSPSSFKRAPRVGVVSKTIGRETALDAMLKAKTTVVRKKSLEVEAILRSETTEGEMNEGFERL
jgi:hypothetical protein